MSGMPGKNIQTWKNNKNIGRAGKGQISEVIKHSRYAGIVSYALELSF